MGEIVKPQKALLFSGILYNNSVDVEQLFEILQSFFGSIILKSEPFLFTETDYYREEMGEKLMRIWVGFDNLIEQDGLVDIKMKSNRMERSIFTPAGRRNVNIDTGYITRAKVVLATTKNNQHRLYLREGIYAEVTLRYRKKSYIPWEWTYMDYRRDEAAQFFNNLRDIYISKLAANINR